MPGYRQLAIAAAAILILAHLVLLTLAYETQFASRWGDWLGATAALLAAIVCWSTSRRSGSFGKRVWRLFSFSLFLSSSSG